MPADDEDVRVDYAVRDDAWLHSSERRDRQHRIAGILRPYWPEDAGKIAAVAFHITDQLHADGEHNARSEG